MGVKRLNYAALAERLLKISSEIARRPVPKLPRGRTRAGHDYLN